MLAFLLLWAPATASASTAAAARSDRWVGLDEGRLGSYQWSVQMAGTGDGAGLSRQAPRPCLMVGTIWQLGPYSYHRSRYRACAPADRGLKAAEPPVMALGVQPSTGAPVGMTAVGILADAAVRNVRVTLRGGSTQSIAVRRLAGRRARASGLGGLRYAAFAVRGWWCAERLVTLDAAGHPLWDSGSDGYECSADGSAGSDPATFEG